MSHVRSILFVGVAVFLGIATIAVLNPSGSSASSVEPQEGSMFNASPNAPATALEEAIGFRIWWSDDGASNFFHQEVEVQRCMTELGYDYQMPAAGVFESLRDGADMTTVVIPDNHLGADGVAALWGEHAVVDWDAVADGAVTKNELMRLGGCRALAHARVGIGQLTVTSGQFSDKFLAAYEKIREIFADRQGADDYLVTNFPEFVGDLRLKAARLEAAVR
jgi:hypothetical protein